MTDLLARCPAKACPVRYRGGEDRVCADHREDHQADARAAYDRHKSLWAEVVTTAPRKLYIHSV